MAAAGPNQQTEGSMLLGFSYFLYATSLTLDAIEHEFTGAAAGHG